MNNELLQYATSESCYPEPVKKGPSSMSVITNQHSSTISTAAQVNCATITVHKISQPKKPNNNNNKNLNLVQSQYRRKHRNAPPIARMRDDSRISYSYQFSKGLRSYI
jgi:hypothetical protein